MKNQIAYSFIFLLSAFFSWSQNTISYQVILRSNSQKDTLCDGRVLPIFGMASSLSAPAKIPARILYCNEGDSVVLKAKSISQNEHHTIHLHGLDVDTRNDGDPATSFWLTHMQDTTYSFKATHAGTYLYHCHVGDVVHVQMGMYGLIVVRAAGGAKTAWTGGPSFHQDKKWLMSEIDSVWHYHEPVHDTLMDTINIPKYVPHYFLVNGKCGSEISNDDSIRVNAAKGEKVLMRLGNIGYLANKIVFPPWLNATIIDSDGRPLPAPIINDTCYIMPGERFSVMIEANIETTGFIALSYIDMNTGQTVFTNNVPVNISGVVGTKEFSGTNDLSIYPNPANENIRVVLDENSREIFTGSLFNANGQLICEKVLKPDDVIDVSFLPTGIYLLVMRDAEGKKSFGKKFIISR